MSLARKAAALATVLSVCLLCAPALAAAAPAPAWTLSSTPITANFPPGGKGEVLVVATNVGAESTDGTPVTIEDTLPDGLTPLSAALGLGTKVPCAISAQTVTCSESGTVISGGFLVATVEVEVALGAETGTNEASVQGGGAPPTASAAPITVSASPVPFGFLEPGLLSPLSGEDGAATTAAGSHPFQQTTEFTFPSTFGGDGNITGSGHPRDISVSLPAGLIGDPAATPVLCTEALFETGQCPGASQVGVFNVQTLAGAGIVVLAGSPLYNIVPPQGAPAMLATDISGLGLFAHLRASVRTDGDYGIDIDTNDILALSNTPILGVQVQAWGDPSSTAHDAVRGEPVEPQQTAFFTMPGACPGQPLTTTVRADSWEEPSVIHEESYQSSDLLGNPVSVSGCNQLSYQPTISSQPSTNLADSPSGLNFHLHQPQDLDKEHTSTAELRDARVTLPAGMVANPSQADGLSACSEEQIGYLPGKEGVHFSEDPQSCPASSKLGTLKVSSPLLAEYKNEGTELVPDPETGLPIPRPLTGSVYLAKPFDNPFGTLLSIYLAVEDQKSGIIAKLAGKVEPDPNTGQLTAVFEENPQLPIEDIDLEFFKGARAALITPQTCGTHTTASDLTPWTAPEGADATPSDSFQIAAEPGGGPCPETEGAAANQPAFSAGTLAPQAGAYSPFVLKLSREDGSQRIAGIDTTLPPGLSGKLAGIAQCSEAQIAQAKGREKPNQGIAEQQSPSCPASSEVGAVNVSAGAGPTPFHTSGHAYLAGPYKGAPLSLAVIVPAVAGPFDLGAVVSRVALYVNPDTAQIHAVSDPLPQILEGIPLDLRSIALTMGRPQFTLNPTSCDPMQISGSATSALGQSAALSNPFQVGGCPQLPFKPKLSLKLKGGTKRASHPKLIATLKAKGGEANVAKAQVKLPPSAFLDQAHIKTVCTRVQFAANQCPKGSIYGSATASTPLLDNPLRGNVYLRSSNHKLPDLVVALKGPDSMPIEIDLDGKTDSVKGALRNTFEAVPDAPVSSFRLELFGGKRGLVINSRNLCAHEYKAEVNLTGQNGKVFNTEPAVGVSCKGAKHKGKKRSHSR